MIHQQPALKIRPFEKGDLDSLVRLAQDAFKTFGEYGDTIRYWVAQSGMTTVVATLDDVLVGFILFGYFERSDDTANILALAVERGVRRQGIGRNLLNHAILRIREKEKIPMGGHIELAVGSQNDAAQALFESQGFEPSGQQVTYPSGQNGRLLRLSIELVTPD